MVRVRIKLKDGKVGVVVQMYFHADKIETKNGYHVVTLSGGRQHVFNADDYDMDITDEF